uniref:PH domain-containing protein n=1 Tax=Kalanchoe fedtschenkoi TaxID=63787 RepID=A0A7N0UXF0_KALFE
MFEAHVLHLLRRYLGEYVHGLSAEALRISVWKGDVVLRDLKLKAEALNSLKLPVTVKGGFVGTITLKVPWKSLGKEPVIVLIDRVFVLANPAPDGRTFKDEDKESLLEAKLLQIEEAESATLEATSRSKTGNAQSGNSWLGSLIATIIGNLKISITNVHIRYEDSLSNPGHPFSLGATLAKLAAVTMDELGNETFDTSGALDKLRKSLQLERLAFYHDSNSTEWDIDKRWEDLSPKEWVEIFEDGINEPVDGQSTSCIWSMNRNYVVSPINGSLKYHRLGKQERNDSEVPHEKASLVLTDVSLTVSELQYHDWIKLYECFSKYKIYVEISHLRPKTEVSQGPHLWWRYAAQASLELKKICYRLSWDQIKYMCQLRRRYIQLYANLLQQVANANTSELREIEKDLDSKVILLWRLLAHAKVETVKLKEAAEQRRNRNKSWFSFGRFNLEDDTVVGDSSENMQLTQGGFTKEEWLAINKLLSYQPDDDLNLHSGKDMQNGIQYLVAISIEQAAARIVNDHGTEILCGRFEQLHISTKLRHRSTDCDLSLRFYGLSSPEGSIAESVSSKEKENALTANFVYLPVGENVDWKLSAIISPCHVTLWMESYDRFMEFIKRSNAISPAIAMETATVIQMKFESVTRRAQEQFQMVLEEQSRFALDIDFDAPKVRIPIRTGASSQCDSYFLLDFGHFTLVTKECHASDPGHDLYSRFYISGRDIAALFSDCNSEYQNCTFIMPIHSAQSGISSSDSQNNFFPLIDRCGIAVIVDQIKAPHPIYPSTRVSVQVPNLGIHFSPARYYRIMELLNILYGTLDNVQPSVDTFDSEMAPWHPADLATSARILVWKGIGNSLATWQPCYLVLSGLYLYLLESEKSVSYQRCSSMAGRQIHEVPPSSVGSSVLCIAVSFRGMDIQKALESSSTWVIEFRDMDEKANWMKGLVQATYKASAPTSMNSLEGSSHSVQDVTHPEASAKKIADLVINGALVETKLFVYGKTDGFNSDAPDKDEETLILEVLAGGGKVHITRLEGDLTIKTKLHSLKIIDELQGCLSEHPHYLAYSVLKSDYIKESSISHEFHERVASPLHAEDDDMFTDALPDFTCLPDQVVCSPRVDDQLPGRTEYDSEFSILEAAEALIYENDSGKGKGSSGDIFYEAQGNNNNLDFVSFSFSTRSPSSLDYHGIDTQMSIRMSKLEFFCNRPTLVALIGFGLDLSSVNYGLSNAKVIADDGESGLNKDDKDEGGHAYIKGLLGYGKRRVVFNLYMDVDSVSVFLNKEDGSQLAMLVQESFLLDLKVYPSSLSIEGTLGNFKLRDLSFGIDHCWSWLCDIRNPGVDSLIKFTFNSYTAEDDDYEGYDYSLCGHLSAVRIVFLYRFVQEITAYFMELASPHTEEAIKLVDKVGGLEWLIQKSEIEGSSALKLDLFLDTPIIVVPRNSVSKKYIQLDLGQLRVRNKISWHGNHKEDPSAVHVDVLHAEILGINMSVGDGSFVGKPMIRGGDGLDIYVRRSLRDVFKKVPTFSLEVKVGQLHAVMSDKEYNIIIECSSTNLCEVPNLPASFRGSNSDSKDTMRLLADKVNLNSQIVLSRNVTIVGVEVKYALLELCNGIDEESPLAHIAMEGLWVSYRMTSLSETDLYVTIPKFSIVDIRPYTKPEMRLMLGSATDASKQVISGSFPPSLSRGSIMRTTSEASINLDAPISTMFLMDYRWRASSQSFVMRIQQPRVLVVLDFLLAVGEFFVPALGSITGREETADPKKDPISRHNCTILSEPVYKQIDDIVYFSPSKQLVVDAPDVDEYIYDGCGKTICLSDETDSKGTRSQVLQPIVIIGRGKRLQFVNVKIENGSLLRKHAYLSNGSSYSVSLEDGVDILLLDSPSADDKTNIEYMDESSETSITSPNLPSKVQSFTFEAQIVSPEFTFYDGTKSSLDDLMAGEKLLRAKTDLSFMYASKENDTWIRALLKDLIVESGSGLIVLDPVDFSGGYTSVKDKTSISLMSTDIFINLSLSVISLILNLQNQAAVALQFGNASPLALCTNFEQIWVSPKGPHNNLTFWRPKAPSNYVILGDCVTSRPIPPSQAVVAIGNMYGRVRRPLGFTLVGYFSDIQLTEGDEGHVNHDDQCSIWLPNPPPGYVSLGCVVHLGSEPPPNHIVYCLRSDLVASTNYLECMLNLTTNSKFPLGFSIWRCDNVLGSFYAHPSAECPPKPLCCDLSYMLLWYSSMHKKSASETTTTTDSITQDRAQNPNSSGWDILRSISKASNCYISTPNFERIWWDRGSDVRRPVSIWRPIPRPGYAVLGDCVTEGIEPPALGIIFRANSSEISAKPVQFTEVSRITGKGLDEVFFWYPSAPPGYASLGCVVTRTVEPPPADLFCCPRLDLVNPATILESPISKSSNSKSSQCWSIWKVDNQACTFLARPDMKKPSSRLAYTIGDSIKPKTRENITADLKLRCFSLTVLDSLCGMMTPVANATITNVKVATHGRMEAMNAVLVSSIAASTFNAQLEAWEPLIEPFDGIFKFETYDTGGEPLPGTGKRVRIAATSILNLNISAANLETFAETVVSWRRQMELEERAVKLIEQKADTHDRQKDDSTLSALDEDDFQTVIIENKLGCEIYLKKVEQNTDSIEVLNHGTCSSIWMSPPRFSDKVNTVDQYREARHYVAVQISDAKDLPIVDDGNSHNFFCALRLVVDSQTPDQQKLFPQSARTKCVKPSITQSSDVDTGIAKWNELFIFEIPRKGTAKLEVEVTNLAAKAGKGEVVGSFSFSIGHGVSTLKKVASARMLHQANDMQNVVSYPLRRKGQVTGNEKLLDRASLTISTNYFEKKLSGNFQRDKAESLVENEVGFWIGLSADGPWECFDSLFPLSVIPKSLKNDFVAMEVVMKNGKKHVIFRGLATVVNDSDIKLDILVCSISSIQPQDDLNDSDAVVEEVFENQRWQPVSGWVSGHPGVHNNDPGRWSNRDFSYSSMNFFEPPLPTGWKWASTWNVDKSSFVDSDGWAYGPGFQNLKWPPNSQKSRSKSAVDVVRRRRWIRKRQKLVEECDNCSKGCLMTVDPGSSCVLPSRSLLEGSEQCLQVRPWADREPAFHWGRTIAIGSSDAFGKDQYVMESPLSRQNTMKQGNKFPNYLFKLNQLQKKDILVCCSPKCESEQFWLSTGADASVLHSELNEPVYDWKISFSSPLRLENRLPCPAEFTIWEKTKDRGGIQRQNGIIPSRKSVHVYSADVQKSIYLTLFVHGGWVLERDPVLILDLMSNDHVSSFWMVHQQNKRRLRISIERDMGANGATPKTIRFFVPYWIVNDSSLLLAYKLVEIEPLENVDIDSIFLSRTKSAKVSNPSEKRHLGARKNIQVLESIEDTSPMPSMLSPRDYASRSGGMLFPSRSDAYLSPRVGIAVAVQHSENFSPGISLLELESKERVDVKAFRSDGSYHKLSALLNMTSDRTKVICFQPHILFINRTGVCICLRQCDTSPLERLQPFDSPKSFPWPSSAKAEFLKLRVEGYGWSSPFTVSTEGLMGIYLEKDSGCERLYLKVEVRSGTKGSRYEVVFRRDSFSSPYRIENRSVFLPVQFRQVDGTSESWRSLLPNTAVGFAWEDLGRRRLLEILADGAHSSKSTTYNIDEVYDHQPIHIDTGPARALRVTISKEDKINVIKISDWLPENEPAAEMVRSLSLLSSQNQNDVPHQHSLPTSNIEFHFTVEVAELGLSVVDHTPEEILYLSIQNLLVSHSTGLGSGISRFKLRMQGIQVDNQLPLSPMPVLFRPQRVGEEDADTILKFSMTMQSNGSLDLCVYPYIGLHGPENSAFLINIHEPVIWRLHEMMQQVNLSRITGAQKTSVSVDPIIQIGVLNISEIRLKVSMAMSPTQRPRGVLGFWSSLMTALGNTENMQVRINQRFSENLCMRQSAMTSNAISNIQKDLLSQPLQLLSGVDILGNASSALGHMSKGVAALSMDKKFIQSRQRQESKGIEDLGDVIREGGGAFAKGLFRGVTGILTKPLEGAKSSGVEGFVQGVGKGIIGAAAQPVSGVLDLLSKTTEGANAMRMKIAAAITSEEQLLRRRLPRVIGGDNLLRPYDEYKAQGQVILQLAESGSFLGQVDLFKVRGKFALSDAYEDHFLLRKGKILIITHRRILLLQQPSNIIQRKFSPARDPCSVLWDVTWDSLATIELSHGKKDRPKSPHSRLILYLQTKSADVRDQIRIIKCVRETSQAMEVYDAIEQALNTYGPSKTKEMLKRKMTKPYWPTDDSLTTETNSKDQSQSCAWSPQQVPASVPLNATFGSSSGSS